VHTISVTDGRERLDRRLFFWSLIAALAGFLFVLALASNVAFFIVARFVGRVCSWSAPSTRAPTSFSSAA